MRAIFGATGLNICVNNSDRSKSKMEYFVEEYKNPKVVLKVLDSVDKNDYLEEKGFHIQAWPPNTSLRNSTKIYVNLSKERWKQLFEEGFFASRCKYDRCHFNYWAT